MGHTHKALLLIGVCVFVGSLGVALMAGFEAVINPLTFYQGRTLVKQPERPKGERPSVGVLTREETTPSLALSNPPSAETGQYVSAVRVHEARNNAAAWAEYDRAVRELEESRPPAGRTMMMLGVLGMALGSGLVAFSWNRNKGVL